jgi:HPt (histidine-containing phosphotransfer) domain-containing protein
MENPVNFANLREITGGDAVLEAELFRSFLESSDQCIKELRTALAAGNDDDWRKQAHAFKGVCLNLGADPLGNLCKKAQEDYRALPDEKQEMMTAIENEYACVRKAVAGLL